MNSFIGGVHLDSLVMNDDLPYAWYQTLNRQDMASEQ